MDTVSSRLAIGALSKRTGSKVDTIRYYERVGLLPAPARRAGGYRLYRDGLVPARASAAAPAWRRTGNPRRPHAIRVRRSRRSLTG